MLTIHHPSKKVGLLYCTVSVYQLVRCTVIIITALLKVRRPIREAGWVMTWHDSAT